MAKGEHLVVVMLEPMPLDQEFEEWPLHITLVPWFPAKDKSKLDDLLAKIAGEHPKLKVTAGKKDIWGKRNQFEVNLINDPGGLHRLHWDVYHTLERNGFPIHQKEHLGDKYRPHFIYHPDNSVKKGDELSISKFALIRQVRQKKTGRMIKAVAKEYNLK